MISKSQFNKPRVSEARIGQLLEFSNAGVPQIYNITVIRISETQQAIAGTHYLDTRVRKIKRNSNLRNRVKRAAQSDRTDWYYRPIRKGQVYDTSIVTIYVVFGVIKVGGDEIGSGD